MIVCHNHCSVVHRTAYSLSSLPKMKVAIFLIALVAVVLATPPYNYNSGYNYDYVGDSANLKNEKIVNVGSFYEQAPPYYNYGYAVKDPYTYSDFGQEETRNGDNTKGSYHVLLPDGRRQIVTYYVNGNSGFVADVKYVTEPKYPSPKPAPYGPYKEY